FAKRERIAEFIIDPAHKDINALQALESFDIEMAIAHREVRAFDKSETKVPRQVAVLEISFVVRPGREQRDGGFLVAFGSKRAQCVAIVRKESGEAFDMQAAEFVLQDAREDDAI